jgi:hypothetical protein
MRGVRVGFDSGFYPAPISTLIRWHFNATFQYQVDTTTAAHRSRHRYVVTFVDAMGFLDSFWKKTDDLDLEPSLRKYLEEQAPRTYRTTSSQSPDPSQAPSSPSQTSANEDSYRSLLGLDQHNSPELQDRQLKEQQQNGSTLSEDTSSPVPSASLFPDGRYAHLWKTYKPPSELAISGKSDQEKLLDVVGGYKERQTQVSRAALENCADMQHLLSECFRTGGWKSRMSMCRQENQALSRCIMMQGKLLRALGYLSLYERSEAQSEAIQMHADKLYGEMLQRERIAKEAKERGLQEPVFKPLLSVIEEGTASSAATRDGDAAEASIMATAAERAQAGERINYDSLPEQLKLKLKNARLRGKEGDELVLAKLELEQDIAVKMDLVRKMNDRYIQEKHERDERREQGDERIGDVVKRYFDMRKYPGTEEEEKAKKGAK